MREQFVGPLPGPDIPRQPYWGVPWCTSWQAFDVPRIWDMVRGEGTEAARDQILGFLYLADLLDDQYRSWKIRRDQIFQAWESPAGQQFLLKLDGYGNDLLIDAACARQTAHALDRTVEALTKAKNEVAPLVDRWDRVTADDDPGDWNAVAQELNKQAWRVMAEADKAVSAARPYFAAPDLQQATIFVPYQGEEDDEKKQPAPGGPQGNEAKPKAPARSVIPPVPGHEPLIDARATPELSMATGSPQFIAAAPGQPVSMLPIPPGNTYAPFGGAYILPGPGVGRGGYVVPMPQGPGAGARPLMSPTFGAMGGASSPVGMMPMPIAGGQGGGSGSHSALYRRPTIRWQNDKGVPPVIKVDEGEFVPNQPTPRQEEDFRDWFSNLAYPWRAEFKNSEGAHVTIRNVPQ